MAEVKTIYKFCFNEDTINDHVNTTYKEKVSFVSNNCEYFDDEDFNYLLEDFLLQVKHREEYLKMKENVEVVSMKYIDFQAICEDYDLNHGDISPEQLIELNNILTEFVIQNRY